MSRRCTAYRKRRPHSWFRRSRDQARWRHRRSSTFFFVKRRNTRDKGGWGWSKICGKSAIGSQLMPAKTRALPPAASFFKAVETKNVRCVHQGTLTRARIYRLIKLRLAGFLITLCGLDLVSNSPANTSAILWASPRGRTGSRSTQTRHRPPCRPVDRRPDIVEICQRGGREGIRV